MANYKQSLLSMGTDNAIRKCHR